MGDIYRLTDTGPTTEPVKAVVDCVKEILAMAERGDVKGIGWFCILSNDMITRGYESDRVGETQMVAGAAFLHHDVMTATEE